MYFTNFTENKILNTFLGNTFASIASVYLDLLTGPPNDDGSGAVPVSYTNYRRKLIEFTVPSIISGYIGFQNSADIEYAEANADAGTATYVAAYDSENGGNMLFYAPLNAPKVVKSGTSPVVRAGEAKFWITGTLSDSFKTAILNVFRGTSLIGFIPYATLFNGSPADGGSELTGGSFERKPIVFGNPTQSASGQDQITNTVAVEFPVATVSLGAYQYDVIYNSQVQGEFIAYKQGSSDTYDIGDMTKYVIGSIVIGVN